MEMNQQVFAAYCLKYGESVLPESMVFFGGSRNKTVPISFAVYLIIDRDRKILIDAGCDTMPGFDLKNFYGPVAALQQCGIAPGKITDVVITHAHHDHIEAVKDFPNAVIHMNRVEYQNGRRYISENSVVQLFDEVCMLTERIKIFKWGGHSAGSCMVEAFHDGITHIFAGDECYIHACIEQKIPTGASCNPERSREFVEIYSNRQYRVHTCHDPSLQTKKIFELG